MSKKDEALKLALGELQAGKVGNAMQILREALAQQPAQQQEPVAQEWRYYFSHSGATGKPDEVVGPCFTDRKEVAFGVGCFDQTALYPPASKPLTDEQIDRAIAELGLNYFADAANNRAVLRELCRKAAHGIKGGA